MGRRGKGRKGRGLAICGTALTAAAVVAGCAGATPGSVPDTAGSTPTRPTTAPALRVEVVAGRLDHPWDVAQAPDETLIVTERDGRLLAVDPDGTVEEIAADQSDLFSRGETGLMGLELDPGFAQNRRFYTCQGNAPERDIRVVSWTMAPDYSAATRADDPLVAGMPLSSGRHGGCRLRFDADGLLRIGTGDAAQGANPQDLQSLGGKTLRVNPSDGSPAAGNPFLDVGDERTKLIFSLGHRNVQGLAVQPGTGRTFAAEHGPDVDDEVNILEPGANYGWNPAGDGYDESVPMTDPGLDGAMPAAWSSGSPTVAVSGATFLAGERWGALDGVLAVAALRAQHLMLLTIGPQGQVIGQALPQELDGTHGRLRTAQLGRDGALYVTTDNGSGDDEVLRVVPVG